MGEGIVSRKLKPGDVLAVLFVFSLAILLMLFLPSTNGSVVKITTNDNVYTYSLYEDRIIELSENGIKLTVVIENGCVYVSDSECRDGICKAHGKIKDKGCIVCLPAGVVIETDGGEVDAVAG